MDLATECTDDIKWNIVHGNISTGSIIWCVRKVIDRTYYYIRVKIGENYRLK